MPMSDVVRRVGLLVSRVTGDALLGSALLGSAAIGTLLMGLGGCSSPSTGSGSTGGTTTTTVEPSVCADDPRAQAYAVGLEGASADSAITVSFLDADPAPPAKGNNTLTIAVRDAKGAPVSDATIVTKAFMPDHGHASSIKPTATPLAESGTYAVSPVSLFMPGIWEITFEISTANGPSGSVKFSFCIDG
jgi:hypothetical protein